MTHGLGNEIAVLAAQDRQLTQRRAAVDLDARHRLAWIELNRALGGGFDAKERLAAAAN
jgi:outer membrane protein TolC